MTFTFLPNTTKEINHERMTYIFIFGIVLLVAIIITLIIYYCIRHKKKYFFDAAGRKFIESSGEFSNLINNLMEIIQFDNREKLEEEVNSK